MLETPYYALIDLDTGVVADAAQIAERRLSDMPGYNRDRDAAQALLTKDPVMYRIYVIRGDDSLVT